jgi:hypothetical integral membrane protein (TIGR02206 family)
VRPFVTLGTDHLAALAVIVVAAVGLTLLVRRRPDSGRATGVRVALAVALLFATAGTLLAWSREMPLTVWDVLPLHLCDFLILVSVFAVLTRRGAACELLYFWGGAGTILALVSPDVSAGFPDWRFLSFFTLHGLVVVTAVVLTFGFGRHPAPGAPWRAFVATNVYAAAVGLVDLVFDRNYLFLRAKPAAVTLLDWLGPWPVYVLVADVLALLLFLALYLPFGLARPRRRG